METMLQAQSTETLAVYLPDGTRQSITPENLRPAVRMSMLMYSFSIIKTRFF